MKNEAGKRLPTFASAMAATAPYVIMSAFFALAVGIHNGTGDSGFDFNSKRVLAVAVVGAAGLVAGSLMVAISWLRSAANRKLEFWLPLIANSMAAMLCFGTLELALRVIAKPDSLGLRVGNTVLIPHDWGRVTEANMASYTRSLEPSAYFVGDAEVGWTVGANRESEDGLYVSSVEGLRSRRRGQSYQQEEFRNRVGLFGDSFVFSEEVAYPDSLANHLQEHLGKQTQILNFGVPGYGVDQALMRFQRARVRWQPEVAVFGFIQDDVRRAANLYTFLKIGWDMPFSKPRYLLDEPDGALRLLNVPNMQPPEIYSSNSVFGLPHVETDIEFFSHMWRQSTLHSSYLFRYAVSAVPRWHQRKGPTSDEAISALGVTLIRTFVEEATAAGVVPLVVYFPTKGDFMGQNRILKDRVIEGLSEFGINTVNLGNCGKSSIDSTELFVSNGVHYAGKGNERAAACLAPYLLGDLEQ